MDGELSPSEQAFFESGGETEIVSAPAEAAPETSQVDPAASSAPLIEEQAQPAERDEKGRFVPHQALHAEREEHKKTKAQLEEISRRQAILDDRWNTLLQARQQAEQPKEEGPPDIDSDIFGHMKWQAEKLQRLETQQAEREKAETQTRQQQAEAQEIENYWRTSFQSYATEAPDVVDAAKWLSDYRHKQLEALSPIDERMANPAERNKQIDDELKGIISIARQKNQNPAAIVHQLAKSWGYAPQAQAAQQPNLAMPDRLAGIAAAQEASKTIGQAAGRSGGDALTAESIASMPPADFERWANDPNNKRLLDKMLGA